MNVKVGLIGVFDKLKFKNLRKNRAEMIDSAEAKPLPGTYRVNELAKRLHPTAQHLKIAEIIDETHDAKSFVLVPDKEKGTTALAPFKAGSYINVRTMLAGSVARRTYSLSSSPKEALEGKYRITVKLKEGGFLSAWLHNEAKVGDTLTATVADAVDGILPQSSISVTWDGADQTFTYDSDTGALSTTLISDGRPHRITVTARDASGNIGRASYDVPTSADWVPSFTDTQDYWAASYVDFLYSAGITTGYDDGTFRPNDNISRQQFAVMLFRYLGLDGSQYESVTLPFADTASIGSYALTAVKALYTEGIISGTTGSDGKLYFNPGGSLTRAQAAAMIGRTQDKGYATVELTFSDAASIPSYATFYIQTMAAQGVISGYADGTFKPGSNITRGQMAKILYTLM